MTTKSFSSSYYKDPYAHVPIIPPITIEFTTLLEQDGDTSEVDSSESRIKDFERHSYLVANDDHDHGSDEEDDQDMLDLADSDLDQPRFRSPMDKEQSAYPTHLAYGPNDGATLEKAPSGRPSTSNTIAATTSSSSSYPTSVAAQGADKIPQGGSGEGEANAYHHPGRTASTGSDLVQVTVEDLMISEEQHKATIRSRPASTMVPQRSGSSTTMITATIRRSNEPNMARATMYFEEEEGGSIIETQQPSVHEQAAGGQGERKQQQNSKENETNVKKSRQLVSAPILLPSATRSNIPTKPKQEQQQQQQQSPPKILTPAQQREAEADANIQKAIELHENNQLEEATHYFFLAAQSENPLGQLMYGLSLRHGWGCKASPNEAIVFLQRAAEFAMGELKELHPIPGSQQQQEQQQQHGPSSFSSVPSSPMTSFSSSSSSPATPSPSGFLPGQKSESGPRLSGSKVAPSTAQPMQQNALRRMGSLDRKAATVMARKELVMALYELGMSFLKGWGVHKDKAVAFTYFKIAADLGDPDSQNETGLCYYEGIGIEKDMYQSAKYYRMAAAQGSSQLGNSWIWKPKYDQYCAAEISAAEAAEDNAARFAALNKINHSPSAATGQGQRRFSRLKLSSPPSSKKATSSGNGGSAHRGSTSSPPSSSSSNNNPSATASSPSIPSPHYTVAGIAAGLASVTAATAIAVASASPSSGRGRSNSHSQSGTAVGTTLVPLPLSVSQSSFSSSSKNSPLSSPPMSPVSSPPSLPLSPTISERKRRWSLWGSSKSNNNSPSSTSNSAGAPPPPSPLPLAALTTLSDKQQQQQQQQQKSPPQSPISIST